MPEIVLRNLIKTYGKSARPAVDGVSLTVADGEFMCLLGPSGCGKTPILRMIAGIEHASDGAIAIDGKPVDCVERGIFIPPKNAMSAWCSRIMRSGRI